MKEKSIQQALENERKELSKQDVLLQEAERILFKSRLSEKNILNNLKFYNSSFEFLDDDEIEREKTFTPAQIKNLSKKLRLRFLPSQHSANDIPYEAILKIKELNKTYRKDLKHFKIVSTESFFAKANADVPAMLFAQTLYGNYYLVHTWGKSFGKWRSVKFFALRNFESLFTCLFLFTLAETLLMPNHLLTTDTKAGYFSLYRMACIFHLLILNAAFTVFGLFSTHLNFSESIWDTIPKSSQKSFHTY
jgi:hypothetical protein